VLLELSTKGVWNGSFADRGPYSVSEPIACSVASIRSLVQVSLHEGALDVPAPKAPHTQSIVSQKHGAVSMLVIGAGAG
jgi:hypothetical protein